MPEIIDQLIAHITDLRSRVNALETVERRGTWSTFMPTITAATSGSWTQTSGASYLKMGQFCFIVGRVVLSAANSPVGNVTLSGLPFTVINDNTYRSAGIQAVVSLVTSTALYMVFAPVVNTTTALLKEINSNAALSNVAAASVQATSEFNFAGVYYTAT